MSEPRPDAITRLFISLVKMYRYVPKSSVPRCRFYPSCSQYALVALERHGAWHGTRLAVARVLRCHPFNEGGVDHVPAQAGRAPRPGTGQPRQGAAA